MNPNPPTLPHRLAKTGIVFAFATCLTWAQPAVELPRASPMASVSQSFGYTTATVAYSRPAVNGRVIWGGLVPYGKVWRAGANEATVLDLTTDARLNGQLLPKGRYGLFILPSEKDWTFIFSKTAKTWGAFSYDQKEDALRITVPHQSAEYLERLEYAFENLSDSGATLVARWEKLKASIDIRVEFLETGKAKIKEGLPKAKPDDQFAYMNAAKFYWTYDIDRKQAMEWIDKSIRIKPVYNNLWAKAEMLAADGKVKEAKKFAKTAKDAAAKNPADAAAVAMIDKTVATWEETGKK
jgi:tetratricopeptide (TPR) repeat protein